MSIDRAIRYPAINLADSLPYLEKLYGAAKRNLVDSETIATAIGYKSLNGSAKTTIAALSVYGLTERNGNQHKVSDLGFNIIRAMDDGAKKEAMETAIYLPLIFIKVKEQHADSTEPVIARFLLHAGLSDENAARAARIYKENVAFLGQSAPSQTSQVSLAPDEDQQEFGLPDPKGKPAATPAPETPRGTTVPATPKVEPLPSSENVLARYLIPLGANEAQLVFTGGELLPEDFDALHDYVDIFKKQFLRKQQRATPAPKLSTTPLDDEHSEDEI